MGYWQQGEADGLPVIIGDTPADILRFAYESIVRAYQKELGRKPTPAELQALIRFTLQPFLEELEKL